MQAKCPDCESGCGKCVDGYIDVRIADGAFYERYCDKCGFVSGGRITGPGLPPIENTLGDPDDCVLACGGKKRYRRLGDIKDGDFTPNTQV